MAKREHDDMITCDGCEFDFYAHDILEGVFGGDFCSGCHGSQMDTLADEEMFFE